MRWDGIGSSAQVVRWDLESRVESFSSVMVERTEQLCGGSVETVC